MLMVNDVDEKMCESGWIPEKKWWGVCGTLKCKWCGIMCQWVWVDEENQIINERIAY